MTSWQIPGERQRAGYRAVKAASWPLPVGDVGEAIWSQVPFGTYFQALPW
jgi:hypothetical protein